MKTRPGRNVV